jgi:hypothetical protein
MGIINIYKTKNSKVKYKAANLYTDDHNEYLCRYKEGLPVESIKEVQKGANALSFMRMNLIDLVNEVKELFINKTQGTIDRHKQINFENQNISMKEIKMLIERFDPDNISESTPADKYTSYSVNKGEKIVFCIREKAGNDNHHQIINPNTLMFVAIHELAHIMTISIGHEPDFWNNMRFLLAIAINTPCHDKYNNDTVPFYNELKNNGHSFINGKIYYYEDYSASNKGAAYCGTTITTTPCKNSSCIV